MAVHKRLRPPAQVFDATKIPEATFFCQSEAIWRNQWYLSGIYTYYINIYYIYTYIFFLLVAWVASIQGPHERGPVELDNHIVRVLDLWGAAAGWVAFCGSYPQKAQGLHRSMAGNTTARWRHVSEAGFVLNWRKISSTR